MQRDQRNPETEAIFYATVVDDRVLDDVFSPLYRRNSGH